MRLKVFDRSINKVKQECGSVLAAVAIVAFFVALAALATLALSLSQVESIDDETDRLQANVVAEAGMEEALYGIRSNKPEYTPVEIDGLSDLSEQDLITLLMDPERITGMQYDDNPEKNYYVALDRANVVSSPDPDFETVSGNSSRFNVTYIDNTTLVRNMNEWDYQERVDEDENWLFAVGETRRSESDARTSLSGKSFQELKTMLQRREVQVQNFNENHPTPPYIESEHDSYDPSQTRNWVVSYPSDPNNPNREVTGIDLVILGSHLGLGSAGDSISFSAWNGYSFDAPFETIIGPVTENGADFTTNSPVKTKTMKVSMISDSDDDISNSTANYGFRISGVLYHYTADMIPACFETPHPYDSIETGTSFTTKNQFGQVIYSPYALPKGHVIPINPPMDPILNPRNTGNTGLPGSIGGNSFQVMRIHFDEFFSLESGDILDVFNANSGTKMVSYTGTSGAGAYTPWAFRTNEDFPLAIVLIFRRDGNNDSSTGNYGYKVDMLEYTNEDGDFIVIDNPSQTTAHEGNIGYNDAFAGVMRNTVVFKPADPELGGSVTNWKVVFDVNSDLVNSLNDTDRITLSVSAVGFPAVPDQYFVSPDGFYGPLIGTGGYNDIADLQNYTLDMGLRSWLEITTEFDTQDSFLNTDENFGWSIARLEVTYDDAVALDTTPPRLRSSAITLRGVSGRTANVSNVVYPAFGRTPDSIGEWWVVSKNHKQILLHFDLDSFLLEEGDRIDIYDDQGNLVARLIPEGTGGTGHEPGGPIDPGNGGGGPIIVDFEPNPPPELVDSKGWVMVKSEGARIVLVGDGSTNVGYSGFDLDRVAFWSSTIHLRNVLGEFSTDDTDDYSKNQYKPVKKFIQY